MFQLTTACAIIRLEVSGLTCDPGKDGVRDQKYLGHLQGAKRMQRVCRCGSKNGHASVLSDISRLFAGYLNHTIINPKMLAGKRDNPWIWDEISGLGCVIDDNFLVRDNRRLGPDSAQNKCTKSVCHFSVQNTGTKIVATDYIQSGSAMKTV